MKQPKHRCRWSYTYASAVMIRYCVDEKCGAMEEVFPDPAKAPRPVSGKLAAFARKLVDGARARAERKKGRAAR